MSNRYEILKPEIPLNYASYKGMPVAPTGPDAKPLPKITLDGEVLEFMPGDTIMQVAERMHLASAIPRYCYHPAMPIAATCRMCTVEVEKMPKLVTSCSTPATDGMIVHTQSEKVKKSRTGVMEFLLTNHPLDCPVCDKAGECELQNYNYEYGPGTSRFVEDKRVFDEATTKDLSDKITLNMNRCVHCERCVRFTEDVTKTFDLVMVNRGWHKELAATDEKVGLINDYQGNLADFCPVGALTFKDFRFQKRVWFLKKDPSLCDGCSKGCNIEVHHEQEVVYRLMPIFNEHVNGHWICDEGRVSYHMSMNPERIVSPLLPFGGSLHSSSWQAAGHATFNTLKNAKGKVLFLMGTDTSMEEAVFLMKKTTEVTGTQFDFRFFNGVNNVLTSADDKKLDHLLRMQDKTPNTKGLEKVGLTPLKEEELKNYQTVIYLRHGRAGIPNFDESQYLILWGLFTQSELKNIKSPIVTVLPGLATYEKSGTYKNTDGREQFFTQAIVHKGLGLQVDQVLSSIVPEQRKLQ
jgi:NADH-quinone oxidoreductase subunit G